MARNTALGFPVVTLEISGLESRILPIRASHNCTMHDSETGLTSPASWIAGYCMTVTQPSERADLVADPTYLNTADISNHKTFDLDRLRERRHGLASDLQRCN